MALDSSDLLAPTGELQPALFPMQTVQAVADMLDGWLEEGAAHGTAAGYTDPARLDKIARAFAYHRAFDAALQRIIATPTTVAFNDKGSSSYSTEQIRILERKAAYWLGEYDTLVLPTAPADASGATSTSTRNVFVF